MRQDILKWKLGKDQFIRNCRDCFGSMNKNDYEVVGKPCVFVPRGQTRVTFPCYCQKSVGKTKGLFIAFLKDMGSKISENMTNYN